MRCNCRRGRSLPLPGHCHGGEAASGSDAHWASKGAWDRLRLPPLAPIAPGGPLSIVPTPGSAIQDIPAQKNSRTEFEISMDGKPCSYHDRKGAARQRAALICLPAAPRSRSALQWNSGELSMELDGTQCYCWGLAHHGRRDPCRRVQQQRSLKPSLAIACSLQRKPIPLSFVRDCSAWPAIGCGRPWKRTTRRHQLIALCGAGGFSPHAARLERARELVLCGTQIDLLRAGWAIDSRIIRSHSPTPIGRTGLQPPALCQRSRWLRALLASSGCMNCWACGGATSKARSPAICVSQFIRCQLGTLRRMVTFHNKLEAGDGVSLCQR